MDAGARSTAPTSCKTAAFRRDVAEVELSRLLEERGIRIVYSDVDRKGRRLQTIVGSKPENRRFFSTNSERKWKLQDEYLAKYHRKMTDSELDLAMQVTKGGKSEAAKVADRGEAEQYELWRQSHDHGRTVSRHAGARCTRGVPESR